MSKTNESGLDQRAVYRSAETFKAESAGKTDHSQATSRVIETGRTEGTVTVIIVNKPRSEKTIDESTS